MGKVWWVMPRLPEMRITVKGLGLYSKYKVLYIKYKAVKG